MATGRLVSDGSRSGGHGWSLARTGGIVFPVDARQRSRAMRLSSRRFAVDRDHQIVERRIRLVSHDPVGFAGRMRGGVPALAGEVEPAAERDRIVDDDDLLMVRPAGRMRVVELEMNTAMRFPTPSRAAP